MFHYVKILTKFEEKTLNFEFEIMAGNVSENNVIVLLSDSEDDANMETDVRVGDAETMIKPLASSSSAGTVEANSKNSDNSDSSVILLDESWEDSEAEMPNNEDSSKGK